MLRTLLLVSTSGIVLFFKEFINDFQKASSLGGIITAMLKFSVIKTGLPVTYIELDNVGVAISSSATSRVVCVLFHDIIDGQDFGKLITNEILHAFTLAYSGSLGSQIQSPDMFNDFNSKIAEVIRNSARPVIDHLSEQRGITIALLTVADGVLAATQDVDKLGVLANHQAPLSVASDIMAAQNDVTLSIILKSRRTTLVLQRIEKSSLVVVFKNSVDPQICLKEIDRTANLLRQVLVMASNLKTS